MVKPLFLLIVSLFFIIYFNLLAGKEIFTHDSIIWYGQFHYYLESLINGYIPFWNPYLITGTPFYPDISFARVLDPLILLPILFVKVLGIDILTSFTYFCLLELSIFVLGAFYLFKYITGCRKSALIASGVLLFSVAPTLFRQIGVVAVSFLTPLALYCLLLFFDNIKNHKRYLYLFCFVLVSGISMNMYIPAYFLFNLFFFSITIFALRIVNFGEIVRSLYDRKLIAYIFLSIVVLIMMTAPLLALYKDSRGELFPSVRVMIKNNHKFKKIIASDVGDSVLSEKFQSGIYNSYGNILNLIYPDMYKSSFTGRIDFFSYYTYMAETLLYFGMIPFIFCIIGFIYNKSRYRYLALIMLILILINMFSFHGIIAKPNTIQKIFNVFFPPLKMIETKEVFSSFFLLYVTMLLATGLKIFFNKEEFLDLIKKKYFQVIAICLAVLLVKFAITGYFWGKLFFTTLPDLFAVLLLLFFAILVYQYVGGLIWGKLFYYLVIILIFADIAYYNIQVKKYVLRENTFGSFLSVKTNNKMDKRFEYFRIPFLELPMTMAYGEAIFKTKGAVSMGMNHHIFTTKRYYDYLTHLPLENQFVLSGIVYPIIRFYPNDKIKVFQDRHDLLNYFAYADDPWVLGKYLFIEDKGPESIGSADKARLDSFDKLEDVLWLKTDYVADAYAKFLNKEKKRLNGIRDSLGQYLDAPEYQLSVKEFNPNGITISVKNQIDGYLYYSDGWSKYWKAYDGKKEIPVKIANYNFKAVFLEKGDHTIGFVYDPWHYKWGLMLYFFGFLLSLVAIIYFYVKSRRELSERH